MSNTRAEMEFYLAVDTFCVAGTYYRPDDVRRFMMGACKGVDVVHEPIKDYPHALAVYGLWDEPCEDFPNIFRKALLGYVPDWIAKKLWNETDGLKWGKDYIFEPKIQGIDSFNSKLWISMAMLMPGGQNPIVGLIITLRELLPHAFSLHCPKCGLKTVVPLFFASQTGKEPTGEEFEELLEKADSMNNMYCMSCGHKFRD